MENMSYIFERIKEQFLACPKNIMPKEVAEKSLPEVMEPEEVTSYLFQAAYWFATIVLTIILLWGLLRVFCWIFDVLRRKERGTSANALWDILQQYLTLLFVLVWILGFVTYCVGTRVPGVDSPWSVFPMAMIHATEMFVFQSDIGAIHESQHNSAWYMFFFNTSHFLAMLCSMALVFRFMGFFIWESLAMKIKSIVRIFFPYNKVYVFWGLNEASFLMAESIKERTKAIGDAGGKIIFVRTFDDEESQTAMLGFNRFLNIIRMKNREISRLRGKGYFISHSTRRLANYCEGKNDWKILDKMMRLRCLASILKRAKEVNFFFLSEDEENNIKCSQNLCKDVDFTKRKLRVFYHARYGGVNKITENEKYTENITVEIVDSSHIAVELLKTKQVTLPVNYVDVEKDATVSTTFNSMVVGFGEVGMDAVRFLYEYAAFAKTGSKKTSVSRSSFHCDIVDKDAKSLYGKFTCKIDAPMKFDGHDCDSPEFTFHNKDINSHEFYKLLKDRIKELNYIVVCLSSDEQSMNVAVEILKIAIQERDNLNDFIILVRSHNSSRNQYIQNVANHFNTTIHADKDIILECHSHRDNVVKEKEQLNTPIYVFGSLKDVFSYDTIIRDRIQDEAKKYLDKYNLCFPDKNNQSWDERRRQRLRLDTNISAQYTDILELRRMEAQDISNSMHTKTKLRLAELAIGMSELQRCEEKFYKKEFDRAMKTTEYHGQVEQQWIDVIDTLAWTEHLRWNASHKMLGYRDDKKKNGTRQRHDCIKDWHELGTESSRERVQSFDYNVVDVTFILDYESRNNK